MHKFFPSYLSHLSTIPHKHISVIIIKCLLVKMSQFEPNKRHLREALLFCFHLKKSAAEAHRMIQEAYGEGCVADSMCRGWFRRFKSGDFDVEDKERAGRPKTFVDQELETLLDEDSCQTQDELAKSLGVDKATISRRLKAIGMIQKQGNWMPIL